MQHQQVQTINASFILFVCTAANVHFEITVYKKAAAAHLNPPNSELYILPQITHWL